MKTINKIIIAGAVGTTFMTLYSILKSKQDKQEYSEPVLLNKLIDNSKIFPLYKMKHSIPQDTCFTI